MNVTIDINKIGESISSLIKKKLKTKNLPECLGNMAPPVTRTTLTIEDTIFKIRHSIPKENVVADDVRSIVVYQKYDTDLMYDKFVLDINGKSVIEAIKEEAATSYVDHVSACALCKHVDVCDKLTTHYLQTIKLLEDK